MKTKDYLIIGGAVLAVYYLSKKQSPQDTATGGGGGGIGLPDIINIIPGLGGSQGGGFGGFDMSGLLGQAQQAISDMMGLAQGQAGDIITGAQGEAGNIIGDARKAAQDLIDQAQKAAQELLGGVKTPDLPNVPTIPNPLDILTGGGGSNINWEGIKKRAATEVAVGAGTFLGIKVAAMGAAGLASAGLIGGVPVGLAAASAIAWPVALLLGGIEVIATGYELSTKTNIPIVGFGEYFNPAQVENNNNTKNRKVDLATAFALNETAVSPISGGIEAPTQSYDKWLNAASDKVTALGTGKGGGAASAGSQTLTFVRGGKTVTAGEFFKR
ncbi:MAG: hypothetical protein A2Y89_03115 [Chloroflexi bacterium RBG_13_51_18]|nr:MAG: hypothetical protein A2Y89_03115 [Chloroflexi bacterium RBG_13_51_18]